MWKDTVFPQNIFIEGDDVEIFPRANHCFALFFDGVLIEVTIDGNVVFDGLNGLYFDFVGVYEDRLIAGLLELRDSDFIEFFVYDDDLPIDGALG